MFVLVVHATIVVAVVLVVAVAVDGSTIGVAAAAAAVAVVDVASNAAAEMCGTVLELDNDGGFRRGGGVGGVNCRSIPS